MRANRALILCLLLPVLYACGGKSASAPTSNDSKKREVMPAAEQGSLENAASRGKLTCASGDVCNPALALVSIVTNDQLERCSGFLISEDEIMTSDHCVKDILDGVPCSQTVFAHFAGIDEESPGLTLACKSIEYRSQVGGIATSDYAIIKLANSVSNRRPLKLSARGFQNLEKASVVRVQMSTDEASGYNGVQSRLDCQASYGTLLYPEVSQAKFPLMTFGDCAIAAGNSGSPAFNSEGEVGAIIQGYLMPTQNPTLSAEILKHELDTAFGPVGVGTQTTCMKQILGSGFCPGPGNLGVLMPADFLNSHKAFDANVLPALDPSYAWQEVTAPSALEKNFATVPVCENSNAFSASILNLKVGLNRFLQPEWRAQNTFSTGTVTFQDGYGNHSFYADGAGMVSVPACAIVNAPVSAVVNAPVSAVGQAARQATPNATQTVAPEIFVIPVPVSAI